MELFGFDLTTLEYWHWFAFAGVFFFLEVLTMGFFFLWFGVSAVFAGLILLIFPTLSWQLQFLIWGGMGAADVVGWRLIFGKKRGPEPDVILNRRGDQYVGRTFTLEEPIENGFGKMKVDDTHWSAECEKDLPKGTKVRVKAVRGTILIVEAV